MQRLLMVAALALGAAFLIACDQAADLIPGEATPTPTGAAAVAQSSATPITVNPDGSGTSGAATGGRVIEDHQLALSVVQVLVIDNRQGFEQVVRYGTGVVVDQDNALIATSYPVVSPRSGTGLPAYTSIVIATDRTPGSPPQREYLAELVSADPQADVAVLRVVSDLDGAALGTGRFNVPEAILGDASTAGAGFELRMFGYPGGSTDSAQVVNTAQAIITGQRGTAGVTGRTWFKTDARMPSGAAGGPAFDRFGALVGIMAQDRYTPAGELGGVRPLEFLAPLIDAARDGEEHRVALYRTGTLPGSLQPAPDTGAFVSQPAFAENAVESATGRDLFDYETRFAAGLGTLYYEYEVVGVANGSVVEERWYLDGIVQESLASDASWTDGGYGLVTDRISAPSASGMPSGRWRLEVYVDDVLHASATAVIGVELAEPSATFAATASVAGEDGSVAQGAFSTASQLLMMFDLTGMEAAQELSWVIFRNNQRLYESPTIPWDRGDSGRFWVGYGPGEQVGPGFWEFELHVDGRIIGTGGIELF